jgi:hypothetical protein
MDSITFQNTIRSLESDNVQQDNFDHRSVIPREHVERYDHLFQRTHQLQSPKGA